MVIEAAEKKQMMFSVDNANSIYAVPSFHLKLCAIREKGTQLNRKF